jgi:hypothetical protein
MNATSLAASLPLAGGVGLLAPVPVAPGRGMRRAVALIALSGAALVIGLALPGGQPAVAALLPVVE